MRTFACDCGQRLYFENTHCSVCGKAVGYDPSTADMCSLEPATHDWRTDDGRRYRFCKNHSDFNVCNWLIAAEANHEYCLACGLNQIIPSLSAPENRIWWSRMEAAKRRLLYTLLQLQLPVNAQPGDPQGLAFAFLEDKRSNPHVEEEYVLTGHAEGLITVNLYEADEINRESQRQSLGEPYRTLLGHFRHESGHYYFDRLIRHSNRVDTFRRYFGDERIDYESALSAYHAGQRQHTDLNFISAYAQSHPLEDWAETWAHYLHMADALETAVDYQLLPQSVLQSDFQQRLAEWIKLSLALNGLNRSMGLNDAYPFVISKTVANKLQFAHEVISAQAI